MTPTSACQILGLTLPVTTAQVKAAYRQACKVHHPDVGGDAEMFRQLTTAYQMALICAMAPTTCLTCQGHGSIERRRGFAVVHCVCQCCGGTGSIGPEERP